MDKKLDIELLQVFVLQQLGKSCGFVFKQILFCLRNSKATIQRNVFPPTKIPISNYHAK